MESNSSGSFASRKPNLGSFIGGATLPEFAFGGNCKPFFHPPPSFAFPVPLLLSTDPILLPFKPVFPLPLLPDDPNPKIPPLPQLTLLDLNQLLES